MKEKEQIKNIEKLLKDYIISRIIDENGQNKNIESITTFLMFYHEEDIAKISKRIYEIKDLFNATEIHNMLEKFIKIILVEFSVTDQKNLEESELVEIAKKYKSKPTILLNNIKVMWMATLQKEKRDKYPTIYECQDNILEMYKKLAYYLDINTALDLSHYFTYLLWNGYFSPNKIHSYQFRDRIVKHTTFEVFQGKGVCLNYSSLLRDFLQICETEARQVNCFAKSNKINQAEEYKLKLYRNVDINNKENLMHGIITLTVSPLAKRMGNHAITQIKDGEKTFYYDPTNILVLNPINHKQAKIINGTGKFDIKSIILVTSNSKQRFDKLIDYLEEISHDNTQKEVFSEEEVRETLDTVIDKMNNNKMLLNRVYKEIIPDILKINEEIDEHIEELRVGFTKSKTK